MIQSVGHMRIALVEDDRCEAHGIESVLLNSGFAPKVFTAPRIFISALHHDSYDAIILDWVMPELSGIEVLSHVRASNLLVPVIMLTSFADSRKIIEGFSAGADDYITKPADPDILIARLRAALRRTGSVTNSVDKPFGLGPYVFDPHNVTATYIGKTVQLTNREFALARLLFTNPHKSFSRQYLLEYLWGKSPSMQTRTLDTHIARLRSKLSLGRATGVKLSTLYGFGYRLESSLEEGVEA